MHYVKSSNKQAAIMESVQFSTGSVQSSMEDILQLSNRSYSAEDRLKMCCRPSYRIRKLKKQGSSSNIGLEPFGNKCHVLSIPVSP